MSKPQISLVSASCRIQPTQVHWTFPQRPCQLSFLWFHLHTTKSKFLPPLYVLQLHTLKFWLLVCTKSFSKRNFSSKFWNFSWLFSAVLSFIFHIFSISVLYPKLPLAYFLAWLPWFLWIHWKRSDCSSRIFTWIRKTRNSRSLSPNQKLWFQPYGLLELGGLSTTFSILHQKRLANQSLEKYDWWFLLNSLTSNEFSKAWQSHDWIWGIAPGFPFDLSFFASFLPSFISLLCLGVVSSIASRVTPLLLKKPVKRRHDVAHIL